MAPFQITVDLTAEQAMAVLAWRRPFQFGGRWMIAIALTSGPSGRALATFVEISTVHEPDRN